MSFAVPEGHLNAKRETRATARWHDYAFELLPSASGQKRLIDVGCGGGGVLLEARQRGWQGAGVDVSENNIDTIKDLGFSGTSVDLNGELPFSGESFDFATCIEVVEHLVRAENAFAEIHRILRPSGKLLLTTPNNALFRRRIKALKGHAPDDEGYHFRFWVKQELENRLKQVGFVIVGRNSYGYLPWMDIMTLSKLRTGKRRVYRIAECRESLFADRFVWLLQKG